MFRLGAFDRWRGWLGAGVAALCPTYGRPICGGILALVLCVSAATTLHADEPQKADGEAAKTQAAEAPRPPDVTINPETLKTFVELIERDWKDRPEWVDMASSILRNEPMRPGAGWWPLNVPRRYGWQWLRERCDNNGDARISREELFTTASHVEPFFDRLDRDGNGQVTESDIEPPAKADDNDPVSNAMWMIFDRLDANANGRVTRKELTDFFAKADKDGVDYLTPDDLRAALVDPESAAPPPPGKPSGPPTGRFLSMLLRGELGWFEPGPALNDPAPDFTLTSYDGKTTVTLKQAIGERPVVLIFGSFT